MMPPGTRSASRARCSPTWRLSASLSRTQGPAMRKNAPTGKADDVLIGGLDERRRGTAAVATAFRLHRRRDKGGEQRMRPGGTRLELGMELAPDEPWMLGEP